MSATSRGIHRSPDDFYSTPAWCTERLLRRLPEPRTVLEPCAGTGAIVDVVRATWPNAIVGAIELDPFRALESNAFCSDYLAVAPGPYDLIITNPPYDRAQEFVERALTHAGTVAMLLRLGFLASQKRRAFWIDHPADMYVLPERPSFLTACACRDGHRWWLPAGSPTPKRCIEPECSRRVKVTRTDSADYAWFVWGAGRGLRWAHL